MDKGEEGFELYMCAVYDKVMFRQTVRLAS